VALATGVALIVGGCSHGSHRSAPTTVPSTAATTVAPSTTTTTVLSANVSPFTWTRDSSPTLDLGGGATADLATVLSPSLSGKWMIVGSRIGADNQPEATVWSSSDGTDWTATELSSPGIPSQAEAAAQFRTETVVVGSVGTGSDRQAAVWISADTGDPFVAVPVQPSDGPSYMSTVTVGELGLFGAGTVGDHLGFWFSTNGQQWDESSGAERTIGGVPSARVNSLLSDGGAVYAAGSMRLGIYTEAAVWSSVDGINWHQISTAQTSFSGTDDRVINSLAPLNNGLVAVGSVGSGSTSYPAAWISPNGLSWSLPSRDFPLSKAAEGSPGVGVTVRSVASIATLAGTTDLVAVGGGDGREYAWQSTNGFQWSALPLPAADSVAPGWEATLIGSFDGTTVVADGDAGQPHVLSDINGQWHEPSADPKVFGPVRPIAFPVSLARVRTGLVLTVRVERASQSIGAVSTATQILTSRDGQTWFPSTGAALTSQPATLPTGATSATRFGAVWLAVGDTKLTTLAFGEVTQARSWISANGSAWTASGSLPAPLASSPTVSAVCSSAQKGGPVVAVGQGRSPDGGTSPVAWVSANGVTWVAATVNPSAIPGADDAMTGCLALASGFVAYGDAASANGGSTPALWRSASGSTWNRQSSPDLVADTPYPLQTIASHGSTWLAIAGPDADVLETVGPQTPTAGSYVPQGPTSQSIWVSLDAGSDWDLIDTSQEPWVGTGLSQIAAASFIGPVPIAAGSVDGELAIWTGAPNPLAVSSPTTSDADGG
jgi:hypothetical protein